VTRLGSRGWVLALLALSATAGFASSVEAATGLALLAAATIPALFAVPPRGRPVLGVVVAGCGLVGALFGDLGDGAAAWISAASLTVAAVIITVRGATWPRLGRRYDGVLGEHAGGPVDLWRALDRGEDPTVGDSPGASGGGPAPKADPVD